MMTEVARETQEWQGWLSILAAFAEAVSYATGGVPLVVRGDNEVTMGCTRQRNKLEL